MLLVRYCVIYFLLVCSLTALSQQAYKGLVYDTKTGGPVPFATLRLVGKDGGMIANEDGRYYLPAGVFMKTDTVMVSCVGYQSRKILIRSLRDTSNIGLKPMIYDLKEVNIVAKGQPDYLYRMVYDICQKYRKTDEKIYSKAYFSFLSECNYEPLEIIEAYCNASVSCGDGISQLTPKNGRIGLTLRNFWSLNTTDILKHLLPFTNGGHYTIPLSAGNLSYHHFKQLYYVNLVKHSGEGSNVNYVLRLVPKGDSVKLFESTVYLNEHDNTIEKIEYSARNLDFYYLRAQVHGSNFDFALIRYYPNGTLDPSFGEGGKVMTDIRNGDDQANAIAIQTDGKIVAAGNSNNGSSNDFAIIRYNNSGTFDPDFGPGRK